MIILNVINVKYYKKISRVNSVILKQIYVAKCEDTVILKNVV